MDQVEVLEDAQGDYLYLLLQRDMELCLELLDATRLADEDYTIDEENYYMQGCEPLAELPNHMVTQCSLFLRTDVGDVLRERYRAFDREVLVTYLMNLYALLMEACLYTPSEFATTECEVVSFQAYYGKEFFGCVSLFMNQSLNTAMFQGITRSFAAGLIGLLAPEMFTPKLNSFLLPELEDYLRANTSFTKVYVKPLDNQRNILLKHYGYAKHPKPREFRTPNPEILGSEYLLILEILYKDLW
jgi:hypothetical protein